MKNRIKFYAVALLVIYSLTILVELIRESKDFKGSFLSGWNAAREDKAGDRQYTEIFYLNVLPNDETHVFSDTYSGIEGKVYNYEPLTIRVETEVNPQGVSGYYIVFKILFVFAIFVIVPMLFYMPILFFQILRKVISRDIFDESVIRRIMRIGWILVSLGIVYNLYLLSNYSIALEVVRLSDYEILLPSFNFAIFIFGFVGLIVAEVLKMSKKMKEEQELTI